VSGGHEAAAATVH